MNTVETFDLTTITTAEYRNANVIRLIAPFTGDVASGETHITVTSAEHAHGETAIAQDIEIEGNRITHQSEPYQVFITWQQAQDLFAELHRSKQGFNSVLKWKGAGMYIPAYQNNGDKHWVLVADEFNPYARRFDAITNWYEDVSVVQMWTEEGWQDTEHRPQNVQWS